MENTVAAQNQVAYFGHIVPYYPDKPSLLEPAPFDVRVKKAFMMLFVAFLIGGIIFGIGHETEMAWLRWTGIIVGIIILAGGAFMVATARIGKCPYCHQDIGKNADVTLGSQDENELAECGVCCNWMISNKGELRPFRREDLKPDQELKCKVMDQSVWPQECLICGAPPVRYIELKNTKLNAGSLLIGRISVSWGSLKNAPYCAYHDDAVRLKIEDKTMYLVFIDFDVMKRYQHVNYHRLMTGQRL
jgi:hypothetical protein